MNAIIIEKVFQLEQSEANKIIEYTYIVICESLNWLLRRFLGYYSVYIENMRLATVLPLAILNESYADFENKIKLSEVSYQQHVIYYEECAF